MAGKKMSKSLGNYIGIAEPPQEIFGKLMSISDQLMWRYIELLSFEPSETLGKWKQEVEAAATRRTSRFYSRRRSSPGSTPRKRQESAEADFEARFRHGELPRASGEIDP